MYHLNNIMHEEGLGFAFQGCIKQGCFIRAYMDVFTAALKG